MGDKRQYYFRAPGSDKWNLLSEVTDDADGLTTGFVPTAVDSATNVAYGFATVDGFDVVMKMPLVEGAKPETLVARDDVDVDGLIRIGRQRRVAGASYATERREAEFFDPELKKLAASLHNALPGQPLIEIAGASADERKLLIIASSDTDPGMVYLYDKATKQLAELLPLREHLAKTAMGKMTPVTYPAPDGTMIPGYLTLPPGSTGKNLPAIVMPHGGPGARDEWSFDWFAQFFAARGYAVLQPNYRGSTGYGSAWYGKNGFKAWETAIGDVNQAGRWLVSQGIAKPDALAISSAGRTAGMPRSSRRSSIPRSSRPSWRLPRWSISSGCEATPSRTSTRARSIASSGAARTWRRAAPRSIPNASRRRCWCSMAPPTRTSMWATGA